MGRDVSKGDLPSLVLAMLADEPLHGYAIARKIEELSGRALQMKEGTLYPMLRTLEQDELLVSEWEIQTSGPARKVYRITENGLAELAKRKTEWLQFAQVMNALLGAKTDAQPA